MKKIKKNQKKITKFLHIREIPCKEEAMVTMAKFKKGEIDAGEMIDAIMLARGYRRGKKQKI
jgi:D-mannonate dehydratase